MCLDGDWKKYKKPIQEERWAWKWMYTDWERHLKTGYVEVAVETGVWLKAEFSPNLYGTGFHVYVEKQKHMPLYIRDGSKMVRVKVRDIHTYGHQDEAKCWVANELLVPVQRKKSQKKSQKKSKKVTSTRTKRRAK